MAVLICTLIFKLSRMHTYRLCVYIYVGGGGRGEGVERVREVLLCV